MTGNGKRARAADAITIKFIPYIIIIPSLSPRSRWRSIPLQTLLHSHSIPASSVVRETNISDSLSLYLNHANHFGLCGSQCTLTSSCSDRSLLSMEIPTQQSLGGSMDIVSFSFCHISFTLFLSIFFFFYLFPNLSFTLFLF